MSDMSAYGGSLYAAQADAPARPPLTVEADVDVCVIGAGLAGLTAAREIARRGWSVAVLEAKRIAWNASGRNTGFVLPGYAAEEEAIIARVGNEHAKALWSLSEQGAEYIRTTIRETGMPGADLVESGWLNVWKSDDDARVAHLAEFYAREFGAEVERWPAERVRETLRSPRYFSALHFPRGFSINPLAYAQGLAALAEAAGARIFENTPALDIDPAGVRKRVTTPQARLRAGQIVFAGNMHINLLMPKLAATLVPCSTYVIATEPLGPQLRDVVRTDATVSDTEFVDNHYRIVNGDRLLWCGRCTLWEGNPKSFTKSLLRDIRRTYPQLRDVKAEYSWTGTLGNTVHLMPQIGEYAPGVWLLSGFSSHGLNTTAMGGDIVARAITEDDTRWRLFSPFELVWAGGALGRAAVQGYYYSYRTRETIDGWLSRRREAKRRALEGLPPVKVSAPPVVPVDTETVSFAAEDAPKPPQPRKKRNAKKKQKADAAVSAAETVAPSELRDAPSQAPEPEKEGIGTVHVRLMGEGPEAFRAVPARLLPNSTCVLMGQDIFDRYGEYWQFPPGATVKIEQRVLHGESVLVAIRKV